MGSDTNENLRTMGANLIKDLNDFVAKSVCDETGELVMDSTMERVVELAALGEGNRIEFKIASHGVHDDVFETICSFGNGLGGDILLGVNDDGVVVGLALHDVERAPDLIAQGPQLPHRPV